jgi:hypothetical protein
MNDNLTFVEPFRYTEPVAGVLGSSASFSRITAKSQSLEVKAKLLGWPFVAGKKAVRQPLIPMPKV